MKTVTAPLRLISSVWVSIPGCEPKVIGTFAPRIDYPGGIQAFADGLWQSTEGFTSPDETRWVERETRVSL